MKKLLRIKWELIMMLLITLTTIYGWIVYSNYADDIRLLALACITTFMFLMVLFSYKTIKNIRKEILTLWN